MSTSAPHEPRAPAASPESYAVVGESTSELLQTITDQARLLAGARYAALGVFDSEGQLARFIVSGMTPGEIEAIGPFPNGLGLLGALHAEKRPIRIPDISAHPHSVGFPPKHPPMKSFLGVPILQDGATVGNLYFADKVDAQEFSAEDENRVVVFAGLAAIALENIRLSRDAGLRLQETESIGELAKIVTSSLDIAEVYEEFARQVSHTVPFDRMSINVLDEKGTEARVAHLSGDPGPYTPGRRIALQGTATEWVVNNRRPLVTTEFADSGLFPSDVEWAESGFRSSLRVPLFARGRMVAVVNMVSKSPNAYGQAEADFMERLAAHMGPAVENERLFNRAYQLALATEHIGDGVCVTDVEGVIEFANEALVRTLGYPREELVQASVGSLFQDGEDGPEVRAIMERLRSKGRWSDEATLVARDGRKVPTSGIATAVREKTGPTVGYVWVITDISERKRQELGLRQHAREMGALFEVARILAQPLPFERKALLLLEEVADVVGAEWASLRIADEREQVLRLVALLQPDSDTRDHQITIPYTAPGASSQVLLRGDPVVIDDYLKAGPNVNPNALARGIRSQAFFAVKSESRPMAVMSIGAKEPGHFTHERVQLVSAIAAGMGPLLAEARLTHDLTVEVEQRKANEAALANSLAEKDLLMREVQHRVKNNMQVISSMLSLQSTNVEDAPALAALNDAQMRVRSMALVHERLYQSDDLNHIRFGDYVARLVTDLVQLYGGPSKADVEVDVSDVRISVGLGIPCGLIINELVTNSLKHAFTDDGRGAISVSFHPSDDEGYVLTVSDNGRGLPEDLASITQRSIGLQIVDALVKQVGGELHVQDGPGTTVVVTIPVEEATGSWPT